MHQARRSSEFVGPAVRRLREQRGWRQQDLVDRMTEAGMAGWRQSKLAKVESGEMKRISVDDVLELAAGLGCSPLWLIAPDVMDSEGDLLEVRVGSNHRRPAMHVREWIRGYMPFFTYRTEAEELREQRFYFFESQPLEEWLIHRGGRRFDEQMRAAIKLIQATRSEQEAPK
jgi:transcriptional regulator with XRE-family HTH domain